MLILLTAILLSFTLTAQEVSKDFHKEYKADKNTMLDLSNRYGDIIITSWDKDQVVIDVKITVRHPDKERAEKYLSMINVEFSEEPNHISAKTVIEDNFNFSGWGNSREFKINYTVHMPYVTGLNLMNRYGNTDIDELRGLVSIDVKYGGIEVDKLARGNEKPINRIAVAYGKGSIDEAGWLELYVRYSNPVTVNKSQALLVDSRYSKLNFGETSSVVSDAKYDTYNITRINNLVLMSGYTTVNISTLAKKLNYEGSYGSMTIDQVPAGFESMEVDVRYSGVRLGIAESASYQIDAKASYGGIKFNEESFKFRKRIVENNSTELSGTIGSNESPASSVKISTSYGTVKLY